MFRGLLEGLLGLLENLLAFSWRIFGGLLEFWRVSWRILGRFLDSHEGVLGLLDSWRVSWRMLGSFLDSHKGVLGALGRFLGGVLAHL